MNMTAAVQQQQEDPILRWVTFRLDKEKYGVNVMLVQEVLRISEIAPVPGAPSYVLGIINLRGNVVTVVDTRKRFGLMPKEIDESSRIVIIEVNNNVIGMLVDSVADVVDLRKSEIEGAPNVGTEDSSKYIQGVASRDNELLIVIDLNKFLSEEEWGDVANAVRF